jgi:hypothetical protein
VAYFMHACSQDDSDDEIIRVKSETEL